MMIKVIDLEEKFEAGEDETVYENVDVERWQRSILH